MERVYKSKLGWEIIIPIVLTLAIVAFILFTVPSSWPGIVIIAVVSIFIIHLFSTTHYTIENTTLRINSGFLYNKKIDILSIKKISETNDLTSSPALSLDRLEITYNKFDCILISPKEKSAFIDELIAINPQIELRYKNKST